MPSELFGTIVKLPGRHSDASLAARQVNLRSILGPPAEPTLRTELRFLVVDRAAGWTHLAFPKTSTDSFTDRLSIRFRQRSVDVFVERPQEG